MLPVAANAPTPEPAGIPPAEELLAAWRTNQVATGRENPVSDRAARAFLDRWPDPQAWADQPLGARLGLAQSTMSPRMCLMVRGRPRPGWDWLVVRQQSRLWGGSDGS